MYNKKTENITREQRIHKLTQTINNRDDQQHNWKADQREETVPPIRR